MQEKIIEIEKLSFYYEESRVLNQISASFSRNSIAAVIGASGSGKSTLLTTINRLSDEIAGTRVTGRVQIILDRQKIDIYQPGISLPWLRRKVGMVFQIPNPLPMSIYKNLTLPLKMAGIKNRGLQHDRVERVLKDTFLWAEVKDRLREDARTLSGGQQQRLCIARALILEPEVLLLDEPTSSLDECAVAEIENLLLSLKESCTLLMVSHDLAQVERVADTVVEIADGALVGSKDKV